MCGYTLFLLENAEAASLIPLVLSFVRPSVRSFFCLSFLANLDFIKMLSRGFRRFRRLSRDGARRARRGALPISRPPGQDASGG